MAIGTSVRIYDLAKDLKQDTKRLIEELRREGADVSVPSNSVSKELALKIRNKYLPKIETAPKRAIKVIRRNKPSIEIKVDTERKHDNYLPNTDSASATEHSPPSGNHWIELPISWKFTYKEVYDFDRFLKFFDWSLQDKKVVIDFRPCRFANYQAVSLLILYMWHLERNRCDVGICFGKKGSQSITTMWENMGAEDWYEVLNSPAENFPKKTQKPLIAIRKKGDLIPALEIVEGYTKNFHIEYEKTLRYIISELTYNTIEHGKNNQFPSLLQFSWYRDKRELSFIVADLGIGIKEHLSQAYPGLESDVEAINLALEPQVSGTSGNNGQPYQVINNAGVGLYISSNIAKRLRADMYIVSENGLVHISPTGKTSRPLKSSWRGTFVYVTLKINPTVNFNKENMVAELSEAAAAEMSQADSKEQNQSFYLSIRNYFGRFAEDKYLAIKLRDQKLLPAIEEGKTVKIDFEDVELAPHSLLNALLATPVKRLGGSAYIKIKIVNASQEIRDIIEFIFADNSGIT